MKTANMAIMSVAILGIGLFGISSASFNDVSEMNSMSGESTSMMGHVTAVHKGPDGNIIKYMQSDNAIATEGLASTTVLLFGAKNGTGTLDFGEAFTVIGLFDADGDTGGVIDAATTYSSVNTTPLGGTLAETEITRNDGTTLGNCADQKLGNTGAKAWLQCTFTADSTQKVYGAYVANNGTTDRIIAALNFTDSAGIILNDSDQLTVTWDITVS
jgi:hypothetical protein